MKMVSLEFPLLSIILAYTLRLVIPNKMSDFSPSIEQQARDALGDIPSDAQPTEKSDLPAFVDRTFHGSCHCEFIQYEAIVPLPVRPAVAYAGRCNCTICLKTGFTSFALEGENDFRLINPSSWEELGCYRGRNKEVARYFCPRCGVNVVGKGRYRVPDESKEASSQGGNANEMAGERGDEGPGQERRVDDAWIKLTEDEEDGDKGTVDGEDPPEAEDGMVDFFALNLVTVDQPQEGLDLSVFGVQYWDGRRDNWKSGCKEEPWPGGIV